MVVNTQSLNRLVRVHKQVRMMAAKVEHYMGVRQSLCMLICECVFANIIRAYVTLCLAHA